MLIAISGCAICLLFAICYRIVRPEARFAPVADEFWPPIILLAGYTLLPLAFLVQRESGTGVLEEGLTTSNLISLAFVGLSLLYLAWQVFLQPHLLYLPLDRILFPIFLLILIAFASTLWSIVPAYTLFRCIEMLTMVAITILVFDRRDYGGAFLTFHAVIFIFWLCIGAGLIADSLAQGIVFSSSKENMIPLVTLSALWFLFIFPRSTNWRWPIAALAVLVFIAAGSTATVATVPIFAIGFLIASHDRFIRNVGITAAVSFFAIFAFLLLGGLSHFSWLSELVSVILQKPVIELQNATGRTNFWPIFLEASGGRPFGSGFGAGERFIQLLMEPNELHERLGSEEIFLRSAHNIFIGAWMTTGWLGISIVVVCLVSAFSWAMRLDRDGRRFVIPVLLALLTNGMTVPGAFAEFNMHTMTFIAALCFIRVRSTALVQQRVQPSVVVKPIPVIS